jgi:hypothetical protein
LLSALRDVATSPANQVRPTGTISVAHVAVGCLFRVGSGHAAGLAKDLLAHWPEPDRSDLLWYLKSEDLLAP